MSNALPPVAGAGALAETPGPASPVAPKARYDALDVLRGFALFGVFLVNFVWFAAAVMATEAQAEALPTAGLDVVLQVLVDWLAGDKANTLFAFLFGVGFSIQLQRIGERGGAFERVYLRRLSVLLVLGVVHFVLVWNWDILHLYALVGFLLFACRNLSDRTLLAVGLPLLVLARPVLEVLAGFLGLDELPGAEPYVSDEGVLVRQALSAAGDYGGLVQHFLGFVWYDWVASGVLVSWIFYVLGRFFIGHWVGRRDYLTHPERHVALFRRLAPACLTVGLVLGGVGVALAWSETYETAGAFVHALATPLIACGYACWILVGLTRERRRRRLLVLSPVGRMALTNYLMQSLVYAFVLFGVGPGLGLAGQVGTTAIVAIVIVAFSLQILLSHWWLTRFRFGPAEWLWRALTYGTWPPLRQRTES